jgi:hypothetical protein
MVSQETFNKLVSKHPSAQCDRRPFPNPHTTTTALQVEEVEVLKALKSFPAGSSGGPDGLKPQHFMDLVNCREGGAELLSAVTAFINVLLEGSCNSKLASFFFGGRLIALEKKGGGIRPIVIGYTLRRWASKCANSFAQSKLSKFFHPLQLGVGTPFGCEAAIHSSRRFIELMPDNYVLAKIDFSNAFNCLHRDAMLEAVMNEIPEIYSFCHLAYSQSSTLSFGEFTVLSQEGPQQGDPLGPLLFCVTAQPLLRKLSAELRIGFMDDFTLGGEASAVADDVAYLRRAGNDIGLIINDSKCELVHTPDFAPSLSAFQGFAHVGFNEVSLLGAPLLHGSALDASLTRCCEALAKAIERLQLLQAHDALVLLRSSFSAPKIQFILRGVSCFEHPALNVFDCLLRDGISRITNSNLSDTQWIQASLPVRDGGLGIRRVASLALPAYLASAAGSRHLQGQILSSCSFELGSDSFESALFCVGQSTLP